MKVIFAGETKRVPEMKDLQELINYSLTIFKGENLKAKFESLKFYYMDEDGDIISVTCQNDFDIALGVNSSKVKLVFAEDEDEAMMHLNKGANCGSSDSSFFNSQFQRQNSIMNRSIHSQSQFNPDQGQPQTPHLLFESFIQQQIERAVSNMDSQQMLQKRSVSCDQKIGSSNQGMKQRIKPVDQSVIQSIQENADEKSISNTSATNIGEIVQELNGFEVDAIDISKTHQTTSDPAKQGSCICKQKKQNCTLSSCMPKSEQGNCQCKQKKQNCTLSSCMPKSEQGNCLCKQKKQNCNLSSCQPKVEADQTDPGIYLGTGELFKSVASDQGYRWNALHAEVQEMMMEDCDCQKCSDDEMLDGANGQDTTSHATTTGGTTNEDTTTYESVTDAGSLFRNMSRFFSTLTETDGRCVLSQFYNQNQQQTIDEDEGEDWEDISQTSWQMVSDDEVDEANESFIESQTPMGEIVEEEEPVNQVTTDKAEKSEMQDSKTPMEEEREQRVHSYQQKIVDQSFDKSYKDNLMALMKSGFTDFNQNLKSLELTGNNLDHCQSKLLETID